MRRSFFSARSIQSFILLTLLFAGVLFFDPKQQAVVRAADATCTDVPVDVTFVIDNSGSMDDHGANDRLKKKLLPQLKTYFGQYTNIRATLITFSYGSNLTPRIDVRALSDNPADAPDDRTINKALKAIGGLGFGGDGSKISAAVRLAHQLANEQHGAWPNPAQHIIVASDEQPDPLSRAAKDDIKADALASRDAKNPLITYYSVGLVAGGQALKDIVNAANTYQVGGTNQFGYYYSNGNFDGLVGDLDRQVCTPQYTIAGHAFDDTGVNDKTYSPGDKPLVGTVVKLYSDGSDGAAQQPVATTTVASDGSYSFAGLKGETSYKVVCTPPISTPAYVLATQPDTGNLALSAPVRDCGFVKANNACQLVVEINPPFGGYYQGDTYRLSAKLSNVGTTNLNTGEVKLSIPGKSGITYGGDSTITPPNKATSSGNLVLTLNQALAAGANTTIYWDMKLDGNATPGYYGFVATVSRASANCTNGTDGFSIIARVKPAYDLKSTITPTGKTVRPGTDITYTIDADNVGRDSAFSKNATIDLTYPKGMTFVSSTAPVGIDTTLNRVRYQGDLVNNHTGFSLTLKASLDPAQSPFTLTACDQFTLPGVDRFETDRSNNCASSTLNVLDVQTSKVWTDNNGTELRTVAPGAALNFTVSVTNKTTSSMNNVYLTDYYTMDCDQNYPASCQAPNWDNSVAFSNTAGATVVNGHLLWGPISLARSASKTYQISGKVETSANLNQKVGQYGNQARCNFFGLADANGNLIGTTESVCWKYDLPADLSVSKTFLDGTTNKKIKQGAMDGYIIKVVNNGPNPSVNTKLIDTMIEAPTSTTHFVRWDEKSVTADGGTLISDQKATWTPTSTGSPSGQLASKATYEVRPNFVVVPCDAPVGSTQKISNVAVVSSDSTDPVPSNNNSNGVVVATIEAGHYNLTLNSTLDKADLVRGDATNDTAVLTLEIENKQDLRPVDMAVPQTEVHAILPVDQYDLSNYDGQLSGNRMTWTIPSLAIGDKVVKTVTLKVKSSANAGPSVIKTEAVSISASTNSQNPCGFVQNRNTLNVKFPGLYTTKTLPKDASNEVEVGNTINYELRAVNNSGAPFNGSFTLVDDFSTPLSYNSTLSCAVVDANNVSRSCDTVAAANPTVSGHTATWAISQIPANSTILYTVKADVDANFQPPVCPQPVDNTVTLKDSNGATIHESGPVTVKVYATRCFSGNVYAQANTADGVSIQGSDIIIDSNSIISSNKKVNCSSTVLSCNNLQYKIQDYTTSGNGSAIDYDTLTKRMGRNITRLTQQATKWTGSLTGNIDLWKVADQSGSTANLQSKYPEGRVFRVDGDLTITTPLHITGKATFIVYGNLTIKRANGAVDGSFDYGNGAGAYSVDGSKDNAIGFIVLGSSGGAGNVRIDESVNKVVGAYYVPNGTIIFDGSATSAQLRPAKGLFIAKQFAMNREKVVIIYNSLLNTAQGAPPGFTFTSSPSGSSEGS